MNYEEERQYQRAQQAALHVGAAKQATYPPTAAAQIGPVTAGWATGLDYVQGYFSDPDPQNTGAIKGGSLGSKNSSTSPPLKTFSYKIEAKNPAHDSERMISDMDALRDRLLTLAAYAKAKLEQFSVSPVENDANKCQGSRYSSAYFRLLEPRLTMANESVDYLFDLLSRMSVGHSST